MNNQIQNQTIHDLLRNRWFRYIPLAVLIAINLAGIFYTENLSDFNTFLRAGRAVQSGQNPYAGSEEQPTNLNPPISLLLLKYFPEVNPLSVYRAWRIISLLLFALLVIGLGIYYRRIIKPLHILWAFAMTGIWYTLLMGQIYVVLLSLVMGAWIAFDNWKNILAGILIGILTAIKPNFLVWPSLLLLIGSRITALISLGMFGVLSVLPIFVYGAEIYRQWLEMLAGYNAAPLATNMSIFGFTSRLGANQVSLILSFVILLLVALLVWHRKPGYTETSSLAIVSALLATQFAWVGYSILLIPIFFVKNWTKPIILSALLF
jgi:arabinofuranan 3-O-arabinosyltransferase